MHLTEQETATVLAALRQRQRGDTTAEIEDIASDNGRLDPMDSEEIDALCEKINAAEPPRVIVLVGGGTVEGVAANEPINCEVADEDNAALLPPDCPVRKDHDLLVQEYESLNAGHTAEQPRKLPQDARETLEAIWSDCLRWLNDGDCEAETLFQAFMKAIEKVHPDVWQVTYEGDGEDDGPTEADGVQKPHPPSVRD